MSKGINRVTLIGNLGDDPEVRHTQGGGIITTARIATSESWKDKQTGQQQERTEWHRVKFFGRLAEIAGDYLRKGKQVYIEGSLRTEKYTDKDGIERYTTDVIAKDMQMLGGASGSRGASQSSRHSSAPDRGQTRAAADGQPDMPPDTDRAGFDDDDIPF